MSKLLTLPMLLTFAALPVWADPTPPAPMPKPEVPRQATMDTADHSGDWGGKTAQPFTRTDSDGKTVDLSKVFGTRPIVLIFYRGLWCPYCHSQMADLSRHQVEFQRASAMAYAISNEDAPKQMQSSEHLGFVNQDFRSRAATTSLLAAVRKSC